MAPPRKVHLFIPCFVDQVYPQTGLAALKLLRAAGCEVIYPRGQTCCGQPAFNSGYAGEAADLAERFIRLFRDAEAVVAPSASCIAMVRVHYGDLPLAPEIREEYESLRERVFELSEYLVDRLGVTDFGARFPGRVAYHASCHGLRELGILRQPMELLRKVEGLELVEPDDRHLCCGFGGTFAAKFSSLSAAIGEDKIEALVRTGAEVVTATDDSCLMHLGGMLSRRKVPIRPLHYARILAGGEALA